MSPGIKGLWRDKDSSRLLRGRTHLRHGGDGDPQHHGQHYSQHHPFLAQHFPPPFSLQSSLERSYLFPSVLPYQAFAPTAADGAAGPTFFAGLAPKSKSRHVSPLSAPIDEPPPVVGGLRAPSRYG